VDAGKFFSTRCRGWQTTATFNWNPSFSAICSAFLRPGWKSRLNQTFPNPTIPTFTSWHVEYDSNSFFMRLFLKLFCCGVMLIRGHSDSRRKVPAVPTFPPKEEQRHQTSPTGNLKKKENPEKRSTRSRSKTRAQLVEPLAGVGRKALEGMNTAARAFPFGPSKKTEEIEKIAKRIRGRMQRF